MFQKYTVVFFLIAYLLEKCTFLPVVVRSPDDSYALDPSRCYVYIHSQISVAYIFHHAVWGRFLYSCEYTFAGLSANVYMCVMTIILLQWTPIILERIIHRLFLQYCRCTHSQVPLLCTYLDADSLVPKVIRISFHQIFIIVSTYFHYSPIALWV